MHIFRCKIDRRHLVLAALGAGYSTVIVDPDHQVGADDRGITSLITIFNALPFWSDGKTEQPETRDKLLSGLQLLADYDLDDLRIMIEKVTVKWRIGDEKFLPVAQNVYVLNRYLFQVPRPWPLIVREGKITGFYKVSGLGAGFPDVLKEFDHFRKLYKRRSR